MEPLFIISTFNMIVVSSNSRHDSGVSKQDRSRLEIRKLTAVQYSTVQYSTVQYRVRKLGSERALELRGWTDPSTVRQYTGLCVVIKTCLNY